MYNSLRCCQLLGNSNGGSLQASEQGITNKKRKKSLGVFCALLLLYLKRFSEVAKTVHMDQKEIDLEELEEGKSAENMFLV